MVRLARNRVDKMFELSQAAYAERFLQSLGIDQSRFVRTPIKLSEPKNIWNFNDSPSDSSPVMETSKKIPIISLCHLPPNELYHLTLKKSAEPNGSQPGVDNKTKSCSLSRPNYLYN